MPYKIEKCKECGCGTYKVITTTTGKVHTKHTTLTKAKAQVRLLEKLEGKEKKKSPKSGGKLLCSHQPLIC